MTATLAGRSRQCKRLHSSPLELIIRRRGRWYTIAVPGRILTIGLDAASDAEALQRVERAMRSYGVRPFTLSIEGD